MDLILFTVNSSRPVPLYMSRTALLIAFEIDFSEGAIFSGELQLVVFIQFRLEVGDVQG
jgi:hypothetical protein